MKKAKASRPRGRPTDYSDKVATEICDRITDGESLHSICRLAHMPHRVTVLRWLEKHDDFRTRYTRARDDQADTFVDLAREALAEATTKDDAVHARVRAEGYLRLAEKLAPKKYGNKLELSGDMKITMQDDALDARIAHLMGKAAVAADATVH